VNAPLISMLYVPGADGGKLAKVGALGADAYILDLEDAVAPSAKAAARSLVAEAVGDRGGEVSVWVRVNPAASGLLEGDLRAVVRPGLAGIVLPKADRPADVVGVDAMLALLEDERGLERCSVALIPTIESVGGLAAIDAIATAAGRTRCLGLGAGDLSLELGLDWPPPEGLSPTILAAKVEVVFASRRAGLEPPHDGVFPNFRAPEGLRAEAAQARALGFHGKHAIHPAQVEVIHDVFTPDAGALAAAAAVLDAYDRGLEEGIGGVHIDGRFIDQPVAEHARRVLAAARRRRSGDAGAAG
jgi:citrate lyase subunit beta / citryl-CoA lyase